MKKFIDENGTFEIMVPATWRHSLKNKKVHTFQEYEIWKHDTFQLSITEAKTETEKQNFSEITNGLNTTKINGILYHNYPDFTNNNEKLATKSWTTLLGDKIILFTLTYFIEEKFEVDKRNIREKLELVKKIIPGFRLIEDAERENQINFYRFEMCLQGISATASLLNKAVGDKSFIEATCLLASYIDALLRVGIVLKEQIIDKSSDIDQKWIYQGSSGPKKSEKDIYKKSKELGIIDDKIFKSLYELYDGRNRVIHRFVISEITVAEIEEIAYGYYQMLRKINKIIYEIESEQIRLGLGMTRIDNKPNNHDKLDFIKGKIGKVNFFKKK